MKNLKDRVEAILFSANRPLSLNNLIDLFEVEDEEKKSKIILGSFISSSLTNLWTKKNLLLCLETQKKTMSLIKVSWV